MSLNFVGPWKYIIGLISQLATTTAPDIGEPLPSTTVPSKGALEYVSGRPASEVWQIRLPAKKPVRKLCLSFIVPAPSRHHLIHESTKCSSRNQCCFPVVPRSTLRLSIRFASAYLAVNSSPRRAFVVLEAISLDGLGSCGS